MNNTECVSYTKDQIRMEIQASYAYLALAAHFSKDTVNRPGFANFFFTAAGEEREHGMKLIEYMLMRGELTNEAGVPNLKELKFNGYVTIDDMPGVYEGTSTASGLDALKAALKLEVKVTNSIKELIKKCEGNDEDKAALNDYHVSSI